MESVLVSRELLGFIVLLGVVVRVRQYAANRSLWLDESFLALNVIGRNMHGLLTDPLDFNQTAPAGFLFVEKLATEVFDKSEYSLRAFPLVCGLASLPLYAWLARRVIGPAAAVIAVALFAVAGPLIYYSSELKPYAGDVAATIAISLMGLELLERRVSVRHAAAFALLGFVLIQLTYAGILAAAGVGATLVVILAVRREWDRWPSVVPVVGAWAVGAGVFLFSHVGIERSYFTPGEGRLGRFAPFPASKADITWYLDRVREVIGDANLGDVRLIPLAILAVAGVISLATRSKAALAVLAAPVIATVVASGAHRYPLLARTMLFLVPLMVLLIATGIVALARRLPVFVGAGAAALVIGYLVAQASSAGVYDVFHPVERSEIKKTLIYVARNWHPGDVLYVHYASQYAFGYYSECGCLRLPGDLEPRSLWPVGRVVVRKPSAQFPRAFISKGSGVIVGRRRPVGRTGPLPVYAQDASMIARHRRAWILVTWRYGLREQDLIKRELLDSLNRRGRLLSVLLRDDTRLFLYEFPKGT
jgi:hypothetical protein